SRRRHTRLVSDWSSDVCSSDLWSRCRPSSTPPSIQAMALGERPAQRRAPGGKAGIDGGVEEGRQRDQAIGRRGHRLQAFAVGGEIGRGAGRGGACGGGGGGEG